MDRQQRTGLEIGLIAHGWFPDVGGVQSHMRDLARELRSRGHRVHALCLDTQEGLEPFSHEIDTVEGVQVRRVAYRYHDHRALADLVHNGDMERCARDWAEASSLDVVHVHHLTGFGLSVLRSLRELDLPFAAARMASDPARTPPLSQVLAERAQVLVRISPSRDAAHPGAEEGYQGEHPLARLWRTTCLGPAIELWRMGR